MILLNQIVAGGSELKKLIKILLVLFILAVAGGIFWGISPLKGSFGSYVEYHDFAGYASRAGYFGKYAILLDIVILAAKILNVLSMPAVMAINILFVILCFVFLSVSKNKESSIAYYYKPKVAETKDGKNVCSNCGSVIMPGSAFCSNCGKKAE